MMAFCKDCMWEDAWGGVHGEPQSLIRQRAKAHAIKSGHSVTVETGSVRTYHSIRGE